MKDKLWENWTHWNDSGFDVSLLTFSVDEIALLKAWARQPDLSLDALVDLATWCEYGTHSFPYLPPDERKRVYESVARAYSVSVEDLYGLMTVSPLA